MTIALACAIVGWTPSAYADCFSGATERLVVELLFGRNIGGRLGVSNKAFLRFLDREVTPRFPDGFTVLDMQGQYRQSGGGTIIKEPGKYLIIALGNEVRDLPRVRAIIDAYKRRFRQNSVGLIARRACVSF